jgi:hypothetical protein
VNPEQASAGSRHPSMTLAFRRLSQLYGLGGAPVAPYTPDAPQSTERDF